MDLGEFLGLHFADERIAFADSKDTLIQALASLVSNQKTLPSLEKMNKVRYIT